MALQNIDVAKEASVQSVLSAVNDGFANMTSSTSSSSMNRAVFIYTGSAQTFVVPDGVTKIYVTASGGGGSGAAKNGPSAVNGNAGGTTVIGDLVSLPGGRGGSTTAGGEAGGAGGGKGGTSKTAGPGDSSSHATVEAADGIIGRGGSGPGAGGGSLGGGGGASSAVYYASDSSRQNPGYKGGKSALGFGDGQDGTNYAYESRLAGDGGLGGGGGAGARSYNNPYLAGFGGGGGAAIFRKEFAVTPGVSISITVGKGGSSIAEGEAGSGYQKIAAGKGGDGIVVIEW